MEPRRIWKKLLKDSEFRKCVESGASSAADLKKVEGLIKKLLRM
jgi:hypothetical protein